MLRTQQLVVGIFDHHTQAVQAINELRQVGFDNRHIRFAKCGTSMDKISNNVKSLLRAPKSSTSRIYNDLINMGMPPEEARYYQSAFEAGHSIVAVLKSGVPLVATSIIIRNGGYIVNEHFAQPINPDQATNKSTYTISPIFKSIAKLMQSVYRYLYTDQSRGLQKTTPANPRPNSLKEHPASSTDNDQNTKVQECPTNDINIDPNNPKEPLSPSTDNQSGDETIKISRDLLKEKISQDLINA